MLPCLALFLAVLFIGADSISFSDSLSVFGGGKRVGMTDTNVRFFLVFFFFYRKIPKTIASQFSADGIAPRSEREKEIIQFPKRALNTTDTCPFCSLPQRGWRAASFPSRWHGRLTMCCTIEIPPQQKKKNKKERETVQKSLESCINWAMTERHEDGPAMPVIKTAGYRVWYTDEAL